jgi:hypothetical protein
MSILSEGRLPPRQPVKNDRLPPLLIREGSENSRRIVIGRSRSRIKTGDAGLIYYAYVQVVDHPHLAREPHMIGHVGLGRHHCSFGLADGARIAVQDLDSARRAPGITAAAVENVDAFVLYAKDKLLVVFRIKRYRAARGFRGDPGH